jgi:uncharacterized coiled-coil protein SlyX
MDDLSHIEESQDILEAACGFHEATLAAISSALAELAMTLGVDGVHAEKLLAEQAAAIGT